jgi:simple sugar transport system permease protein
VLDLDLASSALRLSAPLLWAALGGVLAERAGVVSLALEGKLLAGAFAAAVAAHAWGSPVGGAAAGALAGAAIGALLALFAVALRGDAIVVGIALNLLAAGATQFLLGVLYGSSANSPTFSGFESRSALAVPPLAILAWLVVPAGALFFAHTRMGLRVHAVGEHPEAARSRGVSPARVRCAAAIAAGAIAGLGGAYLALDTGQFVKNMSAGRGYLALAAVIFGKWRPAGAAGACLLFGFAEAAQIRLQGAGVPTQFVQMLPYVLTMVALAGFVGRSRPPAALGHPLAQEN